MVRQFRNYVIFSVIIFAFLLVFGSAAFFLSMQHVIETNHYPKLAAVLDINSMSLENSVRGDIKTATDMAASPAVISSFEDPGDTDMKSAATDAIKAYRSSLPDGSSVYWCSDKDKQLYIDDDPPTTLDPSDMTNYWYNKTMYQTTGYSFDINPSQQLGTTNLWINAPVRNDAGVSIGAVGVGININSFIDAIYANYTDPADLYMFDKNGVITAAKDISLVINKTNIADVLPNIDNILSSATGGVVSAPYDVCFLSMRGGDAAVISINSLGWYAIAVLPTTFADYNLPVTVLFIICILIIIPLIIVLSGLYVHKLFSSLQRAVTESEDKNGIIMGGIEYAGVIQSSVLPLTSTLQNVFSDSSVIWKPLNVVGGDTYWVKRFTRGSVLCVCDCTGHGTAGALLTMLVTSTLEAVFNLNNYEDTANAVWQIDKRLAEVFELGEDISKYGFKNGCDIAVLYVANNGNVTISSSHISVFVCDGKEVRRIKGQNIFVGEGQLKSKDDVQTLHVSANPDNKFYIASDGLFDQPGGDRSEPFGYARFGRLILQYHDKIQSDISNLIWEVFEVYRGGEPRVDDLELITFKP